MVSQITSKFTELLLVHLVLAYTQSQVQEFQHFYETHACFKNGFTMVVDTHIIHVPQVAVHMTNLSNTL